MPFSIWGLNIFSILEINRMAVEIKINCHKQVYEVLLKKVVGFSEVPLATCQPFAGDTDPSEWYRGPSFRELRPNTRCSSSSTKAVFAHSCLALRFHCPLRHSISKLLSSLFSIGGGKREERFCDAF